MTEETREPQVQHAIDAAGGVNALARALGVSGPAVATWRRIPARRVADVSRVTGIPAAQLRPDLAAAFAQPPEAA